ncbi:LAQU0S04e07866g1_1 [Lachancea quebecensis]|uniref:LAQU0S04e07866g1_1 n=1 Tax=Lachancea quebecensis TaxID=1654605 RepID=A0A0N7MLE8_9SACH|nr:LAQU0S04e07866g1_1 [Lachancea quebecensis]
MLQSIEDLKGITQLIQEVEAQRGALAEKIQGRKSAGDDLLDDFDLLDAQLSKAAADVAQARSAEDVEALKERYGDLAILKQLGSLFAREEAKQAQKRALTQVQSIYDSMTAQQEANTAQLELWHEEIKQTLAEVDPDLGAQSGVYERFAALLSQEAAVLSEELRTSLLNANWDTAQFSVADTAASGHLRDLSSRLYHLWELQLPKPDPNRIWNFECIGNNFKIKFIYHFNNQAVQEPQSVEMYFKFLDKYLDQNLFKCVDIFQDPSSSMTQELVHQQFINHILNPIREKVSSTLLKNPETSSDQDLKTLIALISQVFIIDNALIKKHLYHGHGLIAMIPKTILDTWHQFEIEASTSQFLKIMKSPLNKSGADFCKLLRNLYAYFEPFFHIDFDELMDYKIKITNRIFMGLPNRYRENLLAVKDDQATAYADEAQFEQTLWKLNNLELIMSLLKDLETKLIFIQITNYVNIATSSTYDTVLSDVLGSYEDTVIAVKDSVVHRIKKMLNLSLRNYFKLNEWALISSEPQQCSAELIAPLSLSNRLIGTMDSFDLKPHTILSVKNEVLNIIIHYMLDYVINLNKFSQMGFAQLQLDYNALKESLNFPHASIPQNAEEGALLETLKVLELRYKKSQDSKQFLSKSYIDRREFSAFRDYLQIKYSTDSELANAMYRLI